jgi:predicted MFS family arabinose efflux permease
LSTSSGSPRLALPAYQDERSWTRQEAVRAAAFWRLIFVFSVVTLATNSVAVHRIPSFMDRGLDPRLISYATALDAGASGVSTFAVGMLTRRVPARVIGAAGFLLLGLASVLTIVAVSHPVMFLAMITFGLGIGVEILMHNYLWVDYFGRQHLGSIRGVVMPVTLLCGGAGAPIAGYVRDFTGSYTLIWLAATGLMALGALVLVVTPPPRATPGPTPVAVRAAPAAVEEPS